MDIESDSKIKEDLVKDVKQLSINQNKIITYSKYDLILEIQRIRSEIDKLNKDTEMVKKKIAHLF